MQTASARHIEIHQRSAGPGEDPLSWTGHFSLNLILIKTNFTSKDITYTYNNLNGAATQTEMEERAYLNIEDSSKQEETQQTRLVGSKRHLYTYNGSYQLE